MTKAAELAKMGEVLTNSQIGGRRNMIINGSQIVAQRGTGAVTTNVSYPVDRWQITNSSGASISVQQNSDVPSGEGFAFCTKYTVTTADSGVTGTEDALFRQHIEGQDITQLAWGTSSAKTVTLSFWTKSSLTGTFGGAIKNSDNSRTYPFTYTISSANTWEYKTITIEGETSGTWLSTNGIGVRVVFSMGSGSDRLGTAGAWSTNNNDGATGQTQVVETLNATWQITGVQLEVGEQATPFEHRSYGEELALCQRYYQQNSAGRIHLPVVRNSDNIKRGTIFYHAKMRTNSPSVSLVTSVPDGASITIPTVDESGAYISMSGGTGDTVPNVRVYEVEDEL
jgi:hypothetical protein